MNFFTFPRKSKFFFTGAAAGAASGSAGGAGASGATSGSAAAGATGAASGGSQGAGAGAGASSGAGAGSGTGAAADWTSSFNEDLKGFISNKQFKSPTDLAEAYRGLEKMRGVPQERLLTLPERFYDDQGKLTAEGRSLREKLGAPKEAKEYDLKMPAQGGDPKLLEHFKGLFHELGVSKTDAEKITGSYNTYLEGLGTAAKEQAVQAMKNEQSLLQKDWGAALDQNTNIAKEAVRVMGMTTEQVAGIAAVLGHAETMKLFHKFGTQVREAPFIGGQRPDRVLEPAGAKSQIKELIADKSFGKLLESGDRDAMAKWESLHKQAYPGQYGVA